MKARRMWAPKRLAVFSLGAASLFCFYSSIYLFLKYSDAGPHHPDPMTGRIYILNNHGSYSYVTKQQHWRIDGLQIASLGIFVLGALLHQRLRLPNSRLLDDYPDNVRTQVLNSPSADYETVKGTYTEGSTPRNGP
jgi:hypothetical protein